MREILTGLDIVENPTILQDFSPINAKAAPYLRIFQESLITQPIL